MTVMPTDLKPTPREQRRITGETPRATARPATSEPVDVIKLRWEYEAKIKRLEEQLAEKDKQIMTYQRAASERRETEYQANRALAIYGEKADLSEIKSRIALHPTFAELPEQGRALVAQVAVAMGLNPFMHLHAWVDRQGKLNITPDYKGLLFMAGEDNIMSETRLLTREEMLARGIAETDINNGAIAAVCEVCEIDKAARCKAAGLDYKPVRGYAVWYPTQTKIKRDGTPYVVTSEPPNGRDGAWVAEKNALRAALYQISDLSLKMARPVTGVSISEDGWTAELPGSLARTDEVIEGSFVSLDDAAPRCACGQPADTNGPYPDLCTKCANAKANREAAQ